MGNRRCLGPHSCLGLRCKSRVFNPISVPACTRRYAWERSMNISNPQAESTSSAALRLARLSVWLPLGIIVFFGYLHRFGGADSLSHSVQAGLGFGVIITALGGFACGIAALCHRRDDEPNVVGKSVVGLALSSFMILMFLIGF